MAYFDNEMKQINDKYSPLPSLKIARYISIRKLESMLSTKTLFFCNPEKFADKLSEVSVIETPVKQDGRNMFIILAPKK